MAIDKYTLLNIIEKFPTKESRNVLRDILNESSDELRWRNEISHIFYILNKLDKSSVNESKSESVSESKSEKIEEIYNENSEVETIPELKMEPIPEPIVEPIPEPIPEPVRELTEVEKIQLQFRQEMDRITKNKNDEILKYSI
jgi:hypothetical protein